MKKQINNASTLAKRKVRKHEIYHSACGTLVNTAHSFHQYHEAIVVVTAHLFLKFIILDNFLC